MCGVGTIESLHFFSILKAEYIFINKWSQSFSTPKIRKHNEGVNFFSGGGDDNFIFLKLPHPLENPYLRPWDTMMSLKVAESIIKNNLFFKILFSAHNIQKNEMIYLMWKSTLFYLYPPPWCSCPGRLGSLLENGRSNCWWENWRTDSKSCKYFQFNYSSIRYILINKTLIKMI